MQQTLLLNSCPIQSLAANIAAPIRLHCFLSQVVWWHFIFFPFLLEVGTSEGQIKTITVARSIKEKPGEKNIFKDDHKQQLD
jgi:hypothetical protein